jgi:hypothetical protein
MSLSNSSTSSDRRGRIKGEFSLIICSIGGSLELRRKETFLRASGSRRGRGGKRGDTSDECGELVDEDMRAGRLGGMASWADATRSRCARRLFGSC